MKTDHNGCSTCAPMEEQWEAFFVRGGTKSGKKMIQYQYRFSDGALFSCVQTTLERCRAARDQWWENRGLTTQHRYHSGQSELI